LSNQLSSRLTRGTAWKIEEFSIAWPIRYGDLFGFGGFTGS
jgi:hypothetical protein